MKLYTTQDELDSEGLGAIWGCYFVIPINAHEHTAGRKASEDELDRIIGKAFRHRIAAMANYKNDKTVRPRKRELPGWGAKANPEWHYLVESTKNLILACSLVMKVQIDPSQFDFAVMITQYGGEHYCLRINKMEIINPDPRLHGPIDRFIPFL